MECTRIVASIKYLPVFTCSECGKKAVGTTARAEVDAISLEALISSLRGIRPLSHDMPYHWASYGSGVFKCEEHKT